MSTHTKGPWETRPGKTGDIKIFVVGARASGGCVATVRVPCGMEATAERNAALIAAAPQMLDLLRDFLEEVGGDSLTELQARCLIENITGVKS